MRLGYFGGTFDPPHLGHLAAARAAADAFALDRVLMVPTANQPLKPDGASASYEDRLAMVRLLCRGDSRCEASDLEAPSNAPAPNYTIDTLSRLKALEPSAEIFVIVGADAFRELPKWRSPNQLLTVADWIILTRSQRGLGEPGIVELPPLTATQRNHVHPLIDFDHPASATEIRAELACGPQLEGTVLAQWLPPEILTYIRVHHLYEWNIEHRQPTAEYARIEPVQRSYQKEMASKPGADKRTQIQQLLATAAAACEDKKAEDIRILALDPSESGLTDYFLICSGNSDRQNIAITDEIETRLKRDFGTYPNSVEGRRLGEWILMDYVDFIVHVFSTEKRAFYNLERLRKTATSLSIADLNAEIKSAIASTRKKSPVPAAAKKITKAVPAKKAVTTTKAPAKKTPAKKTPAKKAAAKKRK